MRAVVQRVSRAKVQIDGSIVGEINHGLTILLGVHREDTAQDLEWMADKIIHLRIFEDQQGLMNRSLIDVGGELLVVSQFTLYGDCRKGRRPSWHAAAPPEMANRLYEDFITACTRRGIITRSGVFQAMMDVSLTNAGPVTMLLDSHKTF
jgi:D-aminoacyl-tRNA deacylase